MVVGIGMSCAGFVFGVAHSVIGTIGTDAKIPGGPNWDWAGSGLLPCRGMQAMVGNFYSVALAVVVKNYCGSAHPYPRI